MYLLTYVHCPEVDLGIRGWLGQALGGKVSGACYMYRCRRKRCIVFCADSRICRRSVAAILPACIVAMVDFRAARGGVAWMCICVDGVTDTLVLLLS
jgi:hypothetical protein